MTSRERVLAAVVAPILVVAGGELMAYMFVVKPLTEGDARVKAASAELVEKKTKYFEEKQEEFRLENSTTRVSGSGSGGAYRGSPRIRPILAHNTGCAQGDGAGYERAQLPNKTPLYRYVFNVEAEGTCDAFIKMLEKFRRTPLLHKVNKLELSKVSTTITRPRRFGAGAAAGLGAARRSRSWRSGGGAGGLVVLPVLVVLAPLEQFQPQGDSHVGVVAGQRCRKRYTLLPHGLGYGMAFGPARRPCSPPGTAIRRAFLRRPSESTPICWPSWGCPFLN